MTERCRSAMAESYTDYIVCKDKVDNIMEEIRGPAGRTMWEKLSNVSEEILASYLQNRIPGPDVTPEQLRNRSWWQGAEVFVVVDDYDLVATQQASPVQSLQPLMAQARDVGLHVVVARRSGGASRALYEPVVQSMRDLAMPGLLLSGSPDEGPLLGNLKPLPAPPGRGRLVSRDRGVEVVQTAWTAPSL